MHLQTKEIEAIAEVEAEIWRNEAKKEAENEASKDRLVQEYASATGLPQETIAHYFSCEPCQKEVRANKIATYLQKNINVGAMPSEIFWASLFKKYRAQESGSGLPAASSVSKDKAPGFRWARISVAAAVLLLAGGIWLWLPAKISGPPKMSHTLSARLVLTKGKVLVNQSPAKVSQTISQNDTLQTGPNSKAVLKISGSAVITVTSETILSFNQLAKDPGANQVVTVSLSQIQGTSQHDIIPGAAKYKVATPTAVAGVRGTSFSVQVKQGHEEIRVLRGKVAVAPKKAEAKSEPILLKAKQKVLVEAKNPESAWKIRKLRTKEERAMQKTTLSAVQIIQREAKRTAEGEDWLNALEVQAIGKPKSASRDAKKKMTLAEIRKKYGQLSVIVARDGRTYKGAFQQQGQYMIVITPKGKVSIPVEAIAKITPLNNI